MTEAVDTATTTVSGTEAQTSQAETQTTEQSQQQTTQQVEQKPEQQAAAPEAYAFSNLPEGYALSETDLAGITPLFKELGLTQEQADKLVAYDAQRQLAANSPEAQEAAQAQALEAHNKQVDEWVGSLRNDPEFGGAKFDANVATAQKAMTAYGSPELTELLDESGLGSHPLFVKLMHKIGQDLGEGQLHRTTTEQPGDKSWAQRMYPDLNP